MVKKYVVGLSAEEKALLENMLRSGTERVRKMTQGRILLRAKDGWADEDIQDALDVGIPTIQRVWTEFKRPIWLLWRAVRRLLVIDAGACVCWRRKWYAWNTWTSFPTKRFTGS
jgi:hypothetical protein